MNGYSPLIGKIVYVLLFSGIILWTFCIVRDLPRQLAEYVTRGELRQVLDLMKTDTDKQFDRVYKKVDGLDEYLRGRNYSRNSEEGNDDVGGTGLK